MNMVLVSRTSQGIRLTPDAELAAVAGSVGVYSHPGPDPEPAVHSRAHTHDGACKLVAQGNLEKCKKFEF